MTRKGSVLSDAKILILFKGHPGVGKSSLARALAVRLRCPIIDKDDARDCLSTLSGTVERVCSYH